MNDRRTGISSVRVDTKEVLNKHLLLWIKYQNETPIFLYFSNIQCLQTLVINDEMDICTNLSYISETPNRSIDQVMTIYQIQ